MGVDVAAEEGGFAVQLDGRTLLTPGGRRLRLLTNALARLVAAEWDRQGQTVVRAEMPATRLANSVLDASPAARSETAKRIAEYAAHDLVCYFADGPTRLVQRQETAWTPLLAWADADLRLDFRRASSVAHVDQPAETLAAVEALAETLDDFTLAGLDAATPLFGSAVLALALLKGRLTGAEAFAASQIDETFQAETWGEDAEAARRAEAMAVEATMLEAWFASLRRAP
ncbi:MAG: ATP12 family protein [Caulobacteraceae bacterium]